MKVWIDQDLCTGDGLCVEICPPLFDMHDDGLAYVKEIEWPDLYNGGSHKRPLYEMATGLANVPDELLADAIDAAEECPGECIFIEAD
jgi:ferredoxin